MIRFPWWRLGAVLLVVAVTLILVGKLSVEIHGAMQEFGIEPPGLSFVLIPGLIIAGITLASGSAVAAMIGLRAVVRWSLGLPQAEGQLVNS